jgi:PKD repeat protein
MKKKLFIFICITLLSTYKISYAQCNLFELTLPQKVINASNIFEGKVLNKTSFWNSQHSLIYTSNTIEVYKVFKGTVTESQLEVITEGGLVGDEMHNVVPCLNLSIGDIGIFTAIPSVVVNPQSNTNKKNFQCYGSLQGFFRYDLVDKSATTPFQKYNDIKTDLYQTIEKLINNTYTDIIPFDVNKRTATAKAGGSITNFSPTTITAGTNSILTINGSGFGSSQGSSTVGFKNADNGGTSYITPAASQYISWSDTQIKVIVPDNSGTGTIRVVAGSTIASTAILTVSYAEMNTSASSSSPTPYQTDHVNRNNAGGITWQMYTSFNSNTAANQSFTRAFNTWRCATHINWVIGSTTTVNSIGSDGTNVIRFDSGNELGAGILGQCTSFWIGCSSSVWYVKELDMAVDDGANWNFGPAAPTGSQYDFETVMLHELGHGHQLGHVIDKADVMNYALSNLTSKRALNTNNQASGDDVMSRSLVANSCGPGAMTKLTGQCAIGGPLANFSATPLSGCASLTVTFTDKSTNTPTQWAWDVDNNGTTDYTTQNPTHVYTTSGTYSVKLKVVNATGKDSITKINYITINSLPVAKFTSTINSGTVNFTNTSTNATSYSWDFGDSSSSSTATSPTHTYTISGTYTVKLTSKNTCGNNTLSQTFTINLPASKPIAAFSANKNSGCAPLSLTFSDLSSNTPTEWFWDIDNNGTIDYTTQNPNHTYNKAGVYTVKLKISNSAGADSITKTNYITVNPQPIASVSSTVNFGTANFTNISTNANTFNWNFGDGSASSSTSLTLSHTYTITGTYTLTLTATNVCGSNSITNTITINNITPPPLADFTFTTSAGCSPLSVNFTDNSANTPTSWAWDIDNNGTIDYTVQNPTHNYFSAGIYTIKLKVGNTNGYDSITKTNIITVKASPTVISALNQTICSGQSVLTKSFSSNPNGATYIWTNSNTTIGLGATGTGNIPGFTTVNTTNAAITTTITVTPTLNGCSGIPSSYLITVNPTPNTTFSYTKSTFCQGDNNPSPTIILQGGAFSSTYGLSIDTTSGLINLANSILNTYTVTYSIVGQCTDSSSESITITNNPNARFEYNSPFCEKTNVNTLPIFNNGTSAGTFSATSGLIFVNTLTGQLDLFKSLPGNYTITNSIAATGGCAAATASNTITINALPLAAFTSTINSYTANLTNSSLYANSYNWNFGDMNSSTSTNLSHTYKSAGTYTITLTASNTCGTNNNSAQVTIEDAGTGIYENSYADTFLIYPNPSTGVITIEFSHEITSGNMSFFNYLGEMVLSIPNINNSKKLSIDLTNLPNGIYCLFCKINGTFFAKNVVLVK